MFKQVPIIPLSWLQMYGVPWFPGLRLVLADSRVRQEDHPLPPKLQRAEVLIKGPSLGRDATLRAIHRSGILLTFVWDVTPMPHNGCKPPKKRRV